MMLKNGTMVAQDLPFFAVLYGLAVSQGNAECQREFE
jgi:hypothetical protein